MVCRAAKMKKSPPKLASRECGKNSGPQLCSARLFGCGELIMYLLGSALGPKCHKLVGQDSADWIK